jgi:hypothetical protein
MSRFQKEPRDIDHPESTDQPQIPHELWIAIHARIRHGYYERPEVMQAIIERLLSDLHPPHDDSMDA